MGDDRGREAEPWDDEYRRQGIPSSHRVEPSTVVRWGLTNWSYLREGGPASACDLGCGTGRNSVFLASQGVDVHGLDFSERAISLAHERLSAHAQVKGSVDFRVHDLRDGLPFPDNAVDFAMDIFVYFHLLSSEDRRAYRGEVARVLSHGGLLLLSLADRTDEFYASCDELVDWQKFSDIPLVLDPTAQVGNLMFDLRTLEREFSDTFDLEMAWIKRTKGTMHGSVYRRVTLATLWGPTRIG